MVSSIIYTVLLAAVAMARPHGDRVVDISEIVDLKLEMDNRLSADANTTTVDYGSGFVSLVSYEDAVGVGLDSLYRTGDCNMTFRGDSITYVYNIGQKVLATFFRKITYEGKSGSGYYRAFENNLEFSYTINYRGADCNARLESLNVTMGQVMAYMKTNTWNSTSDEEFNDFIQQSLLPSINKKLEGKSHSLEQRLESIYCQNSNKDQHATAGLDLLRKIIFE